MKSLIGYLSCIAIAFCYTFFWDERCGMIMLAVLFVAPTISIAMTLLAKNKMQIDVHSSILMLNKGEEVVLSATLKAAGIIPAPFIELSFFNEKNFSTSISKYALSIRARKPVIIQQRYTARIWGVAQIGIEEVVISDYLGLVKFTLYKDHGLHEYANTVEIYPNIPDAPVKSELVRSICDAVAYDDNEETTDNTITTSGFPGYEHKEYIPGDLIKRINWKLSSKREVLMVRLDEAIANSKQVLILDCCNNQLNCNQPEEKYKQLIQDEKIVESILAILNILVKQGVESRFYYFSGTAWTEFMITRVNDIITLQYNLAKYKFQPQIKEYSSNRVPLTFLKEQKKVKTITVFSSCFDEGLAGQIQTANQMGMVVQTVLTEEPIKQRVDNMWLVNDCFEFISI